MQSIADYDSSDEEEEQVKKVGVKRSLTCQGSHGEKSSKMPKLPAFFSTDPTPATNEKSQHKGKVRSVPHRVNSWATYVYFQVDLAEDKQTILKHCVGLEEIEQQHISLSRTIYLKMHELDSFVQNIRLILQHTPSFDISFAQMAQLTNDEKTRTFVTLEVGSGYNELLHCVKRVDKVVKSFHQPEFYDPPRFHTSIAWSLKEDDVTKLKIPSSSCIDGMMNNHFHLSRLYIKQGNRISHIDLK